MSVKDYKELEVYRLAFEAAMEIFEISKKFPPEERYSLTDQIRRAPRSVCANIAEAWRKRRYEAAFVSKLSDADTEAAETEVWLDFSLKCGYIQEAAHKKLKDKYDHICRQLSTMMKDAPSWCHSSSSHPPPHAERSTLNAPRSSPHAERSTLNAPRSSPHAERSTLNAPRSSPHAERSTLNAPRSSAFSLIEVTLAMLVLAVGILGILVLFPAGLEQNERSIADTRAAIFAGEVFASLQARAETNWNKLSDSYLPVAAPNLWSPAPQVRFDSYNTPLAMRYTNTTGVENHALRYRLVMTGTNGLSKNATLWVWLGEFGTTNDPRVFYGEFFRWQP